MLSDPQIAVAVAVVALITFACRILPFALLRGRRRSPLLEFLSHAMPLGVMVVLVAYTLSGVSAAPASWAPAVCGIGATAGLHLWRGSIALSLIGGTGAYVALSLLLA
ncbi:AzlD domain-containing protein [Actinomyces bowdenii]|uniref:branched-chain amino acid transporter permease n=1 Tax=Actinomyces bowdenii TaxID=131109 RepID=UPI001ABC17FE|nr:AzlD domain-containing protein [Actinomyces bowdenii]MBO3723544.1 AzlD domain-containing protein [Actinomyces bowdenii]